MFLVQVFGDNKGEGSAGAAGPRSAAYVVGVRSSRCEVVKIQYCSYIVEVNSPRCAISFVHGRRVVAGLACNDNVIYMAIELLYDVKARIDKQFRVQETALYTKLFEKKPVDDTLGRHQRQTWRLLIQLQPLPPQLIICAGHEVLYHKLRQALLATSSSLSI
jgi:hypothetical protein